MDVEFEFKEKNGGACVTKLLAPGAVCVVPESLGGLPVTELADKVFSGSTVEKVYLPRTLTRIGRYEFYGCEKLQEIHFYGALRDRRQCVRPLLFGSFRYNRVSGLCNPAF